MQTNQPMFDVNNRQLRENEQAQAVRDFIQAAREIREMRQEMARHNDQFERLNDEMEREAAAREKEDRKNRRFTLAMCFLTAVLTLLVDNISIIIAWAKSLSGEG